MQILNMELSDNAAEQIQKLSESFQKPVRYFFSDNSLNKDAPPEDGDGQGYYIVYLPANLDRRTFEANVLYELFHIRQFEAGFPTLCNKDSIMYNRDSKLVDGLGSSIFFGVLDLDVFERMRECRYIDAVYRFVGSVFQILIEYASHVYGKLDNKYVYAQLVLDLSKVLYHANAELDTELQEAYKDHPQVLEKAFALRDLMHQNPPDAPDTAAVTMGILIDRLELWDLFYIKINDERIRTKTEFEAYFESVKKQSVHEETT